MEIKDAATVTAVAITAIVVCAAATAVGQKAGTALRNRKAKKAAKNLSVVA